MGPTGQSKAGGLILNTGGAVNGLIVDKGSVGIGTTNPSQKLDVAGQIHATGDICTDQGGGVCLSTGGGGGLNGPTANVAIPVLNIQETGTWTSSFNVPGAKPNDIVLIGPAANWGAKNCCGAFSGWVSANDWVKTRISSVCSSHNCKYAGGTWKINIVR